MQLQGRARESLTPQQLREWYASWGRRGARSGSGSGVGSSGASSSGQVQLQRRPREALSPQQLREWYASWGFRGGRSGSLSGVGRSGASGSGQVQLQRRPREALSPQQLREWYAQSSGSLSPARCPYIIRTGVRTGQPCGTPSHTESRCFARLSDVWRTEFGDDAELPSWLELLRQRVDIFALDYDALLTAMYALSTSAEGACHLSAPPDTGIEPAALDTGEAAALGARVSIASGAGEAAALGAAGVSVAPGAGEAAALGTRESVPSGTASTEALHTFTLDSGASRCSFRNRTALEQLAWPVAVSLADPSGGPVIATSSTVLPCPAVPSGTLSGLYLPSFSTNLVAGSALQDGGVHQFTPAYERVTHCTCARTGRHLATFTRQPGSDLYTLTTESPQVAASASASGQLSAPCSCRSLVHETVLWHHLLGHPSVQRLRGMHSRYLVSGLLRVLPPLPPSPAPPCLPCVEGRQRAAPHSSSFPPTSAPLQTLHMDVWGPARVHGQGHERYFLIVVDDYLRYTTVFPLRTKGEVPDALIRWIRAARLQLSERFHSDFPVLRLHSDRVVHAFGLSTVEWVVERRIGLVMETSPTLRWTGEVGDASRFRVWGSRAFIHDTSADKLSSRAVPCVFLGFVPGASGWQFYHATSRRVLPSQDVTFDESVPYYRLFPYLTAPLPPPASLPRSRCCCAVDSRPAWGAETEGAEPECAELGCAEPRGAEPGGAEPGGAESGGAEPEVAESGEYGA
ncbi:unnamed protein product [Closterium sp. NIES-53]